MGRGTMFFSLLLWSNPPLTCLALQAHLMIVSLTQVGRGEGGTGGGRGGRGSEGERGRGCGHKEFVLVGVNYFGATSMGKERGPNA